MNFILVSSPTTGAGKTTTIVALGQRLRRTGTPARYYRLPGRGANVDADFVATTLRLDQPRDKIVTSLDGIEAASTDNNRPTFVEAGDETSQVDSGGSLKTAAVTLIVARFQSEGLVEAVRQHAGTLPTRQTAVLINAVPDKGMRAVQNQVAPALQASGLPVIGIVPQDRILLGLTVGELADRLGAEVLCAADQLGLPVEAVMISAMSDEGAEEYFRRIGHKAVVAGGDRPDIHMPALATDTSCIVLTEGHDPDPTVFKTAEDQGVPLLKVRPSTVETLEHISDALAGTRFLQAHKVSRAAAIFGTSVDDDALRRLIGVAEPGAEK
jgi:BioD-like phosphotransacetylase family protein